MDKQLFEQTKTELEEPTKTEVQEKTEEVSLGKFRDAQTLLGAYNSLQAEFTKRCQRIKELEGLLTLGDKTEKANERATANVNSTASLNQTANTTQTGNVNLTENAQQSAVNQTLGASTISNLGAEGKNASQSVPHLVAEGKYSKPVNAISEEDKEQILKEYLKGVAGKKQTAIIMDGFGSGLKTLAKKPKTFAEAGDIVREMFKN